LPYAPDFRWMLGRDDTLWYPATKLFRQTEIGDWDEVINKIENALNCIRILSIVGADNIHQKI
jgi:hypothetical protein